MSTPLPPILCLGFPTWEGEYQKSTVQLMQALSAHHRVLYVEYPFTWKDAYQGLRHGNRPWRRILGQEARLRPMSNEGGALHVLTLPPLLPINGLRAGNLYEKLARYNAAVARRSIRRALRQLGYERPLLLTAFNPFLGTYLHGRLGEQKHFYYCYDEIGAARWTHRHGPRLEQRLRQQVDGLITSSAPLLADKGGHRPGLVLKNGANVALFERAFAPVPDRSGPPTLGYLGSIDNRLDLHLLEQTLAAWPEARLLMVGRIADAAVGERLARHPRIELAGAFGPEELPQWLKRMHLGLIPFVRNDFTRYIYPLKINEYLAAGLPVVSTPFGDLSDFAGVARVEAGLRFAEACQTAWAEDCADLRRARRAFARQQSWEGRAVQLAQWLSQALTETPHSAPKLASVAQP